MGWDLIPNIIDGLFGLSPEQRRRKIKDEIDKLEAEKSELLIYKANAKKAGRILDINRRLISLNKRLQNSV